MKFLASIFRMITSIVPRETLLAITNSLLMLILPAPTKNLKRGPVTIVGMLRATSGLGYAARLTLNALDQAGYQLTCFDISKLVTKNFLEVNLPVSLVEGEGGVLIIQANPIHIPIILFLIGRKKLRGKKIVAYSVWETTKLPKSWIRPCKLVHEIWTPSDFASDIYSSFVQVPVHTVLHPLSNLPSYPHLNKEGVVLVLIADLSSGFIRKNILGNIKVFLEAQNRLPEIKTELKIKLSNKDQYPVAYRQIIELIHNNQSVQIQDGYLNDQQMLQFISDSDIVLSLHRSEGFGLVLAQAMWQKKAILATGWSGNLSFLPDDCASYISYKLVDVDDKGGIYDGLGQWAEPDLEDAANKLTHLIMNQEVRELLGKRAYQYAQQVFNQQNFEQQVAQSLINGVKNDERN